MKKSPSLEEVQEIYNRYKKDIFKEIEKETKIKFKVKEINFEKWKKDYWSCGRDKILIGDYHKPKSKILTSIIHEAIHINTSHLKMNYNKNSLAVEIATCILTSMIVRKLNKKFNKRFKMNKFDEYYKKYEKKSMQFEKKKSNKNFYDFFKLIKEEVK